MLPLAAFTSLLILAVTLIPPKKVKWTVPIDALPVELLRHIFCLLRHFDEGETGTTLYIHAPPWVPILHVCSSWRTVALECKDLWTMIPLEHRKWTEMALRLSQPFDIALRVPGERLFAPGVPRFTDAHVRRVTELFNLVLGPDRSDLSRVNSLELNMHPRECPGEQDLLGRQSYTFARVLFAPLRDKRMDKLHSLAVSHADLTSGSLFGGGWMQNIRHLDLTACRFSNNLNLLALPLVSLKLNRSDFRGSFAELLTVLDSCKSLRTLTIIESLSPRRRDELFGGDASFQQARRFVSLPLLQTLTLITSPLLASVYLAHFVLPSEASVVVIWLASDHRVLGALKPRTPSMALEQLTFEPNPELRVSWLSLLCVVFVRHIYRAIATEPNHKHFDRSSLSSHPITQEFDEQTVVTQNGLEWRPDASVIAMLGGIGTQSTTRSVFGVTTAIREASEWAPIFETMRQRCGHAYSVPAVFFCKATTESERSVKPCLTLIALDRVDFTTPYMKAYFPVVKRLLRQPFLTSDTTYNVDVLFPFGLELDAEQKADMHGFNVRICDYDAEYPFPEFY